MAEVLYDSPYEVHDPRFAKLINPGAKLERLATGCRWAEGRPISPPARYLIWSDIPNDRMMRWDETDGSVACSRSPSGNHNGHTVDRQGRLVACEHRGRRVSRIEHDGSPHRDRRQLRRQAAELAQRRRRASPTARSGSPIRPTASTATTRATPAASEIGASQRLPHRPRERRRSTLVVDDIVQPERPRLLARREAASTSPTPAAPTARTAAPHPRLRRRRRRRDAVGGEVFADLRAPASSTASALDDARQPLASAGDGVHCFAPDGTLIGKIRVPEVVANVCFGGRKRNRLFICATTSIYAIYLLVRGHRTF